MKFLLVLGFVALACANIVPDEGFVAPRAPILLSHKIAAYVRDLKEAGGEVELGIDNEEGHVEVAPQFVVSWQVRRFIRKLQKQMPCGFPDYGIPPLAPLKVSEAEFELKKGILETFDKVFRFRVDGLDNFDIKKLKLNLITSKVTFDFLFKNVAASAQKYDTDTILDAMRQFGLSVQYEGDGTLDFGLKNLRVAGTLKYKIPILWGSIKITSLKTKITLGECQSDISGFMGNGNINRMINTQIESFVESAINDNQDAISNAIEDNLVPRVNKILKGNDFWTLIDYIFSSSEGEKEDDPIVVDCVPPSDPWA